MKFQLKLVSTCLQRKEENLLSPLYGHKIQRIFHVCQRNIFSTNVLCKNYSDRKEDEGMMSKKMSKKGRGVATELRTY